jgi:hypothetical protein
MKRIIYKNEKDTVIKEIVLKKDEYFSNPKELEGIYKIREFYLNDKLDEYVIFVEGHQNRKALLDCLGFKSIKVVIGVREYLGVFRHEKLYHYDNNELKSIRNEVFDSDNNVIMSSFTEDVVHETPYWNGTSKYYYDKRIRADEALFECYYDDHGKLIHHGKLIPITIDVEELGYGDHDGTWVYNDEDGVHDLMKIFKMPRHLAEFYVSSEILPKKIS